MRKNIAKHRAIDFTTGNTGKSLALYFLPILAGGLIQQLYSTVDAVVLGQFAGKEGLAAIDSIASLLRLPVNFFVGFSTGATILISQYFGAKDEKALEKAVCSGVVFAAVGGAALSLACVLAAPLGLQIMGVPEEIYALTLRYVRIYFAGLMVSLVYNIGAGILRAVGDSRTPFLILAAAGLMNVLLDLLFVAVFHWSAPGAALATVISQAFSAVAVLLVLSRATESYRLHWKGVAFDFSFLRAVLKIGLPIALQSSLYPISNMTVQSTVNQTGTNHIVAWAMCGKLDFLIWLIADSLAAAVSTFVAQNYGAQQFPRSRRGVKVGMGMSVGLVVLVSAILFLWSEPLGGLILNTADRDVAAITGKLMQVMAPFYFLYAVGSLYASAIQGTGESLRPMIVTLLCTCATRILWVLLYPHNFDLVQILLIYPISWGLNALAFFIYYHIFLQKGSKTGGG